MANPGTLKVELEGRGPLTLRQADYVATGGEGSVYRASATVVKIYNDVKKMQRDGMREKIRLLSQIHHPYISAPQGIVNDTNGHPIGFYGTFAEGEPLPRVFTTAFRTREKFGDEHAKTLAHRMQEAMQCAHDHKAVMVDPNELNWVVALAGKKGPEPRVFDVDSWAIGKWGASVIMPSIRDWHSSGFTPQTDWFAWGILTFQIFTGIHPYRGTLTGYQPGDLESRMKANASVFAPQISLNRAVRDFSCIPQPLLSWYEETFQKGKRSKPPSPFDKGIAAIAPQAQVYRTITTATGNLVYEKLFAVSGKKALRVYFCGAVLMDSGVVIDLQTKREIITVESHEAEVVKCKDGWLIADWHTAEPVFSFVDERTRTKQTLPLVLKGRHVLRYENRLFLVHGEELAELTLMQVGRPLLTVGKRTAVLTPLATRWFDGVGVQEAFGAKFLVLPFGESACVTVRVRELDQLKPVSAKAGNRFVSLVMVDRKGVYQKVELAFTTDYSSYKVWQGGADGPELNMAILGKGVCATITNDGELVIFVPSNGNVNKVQDRQISTDMQLSAWGDTVVYIENGAVWKLRMK
jgi:hypothetical protein